MRRCYHQSFTRRKQTLWALWIIVLLSGPSRVGAQTAEVARLVKELSAHDFKVREAATTELLEMGETALVALEALGEDLPLESRLRVADIRARLQKKATKVDTPLDARLFTLELKDRALGDIVEHLAKITGQPLRLGNSTGVQTSPPTPDADLAARACHLAASEAPFFRILDQLCAQEELQFIRDYRSGDIVLYGRAQETGPVVHVGPLRVALTSFSLSRTTQFTGPANTFARLQVRVDVENSAPIVGFLNPSMDIVAEDDLGRPVGTPDQRSPRHLMALDQRLQSYVSVELEPPQRDAKFLKKLTLPLDAVVPAEMVDCTLVAPQAPMSDENAVGTIRLKMDRLVKTPQGDQVTLSFTAPPVEGDIALPAPPRYDVVRLFDIHGREIVPTSPANRQVAGTREVRTVTLPEGSEIGSITVRSMVRYRVARLVVSFADVPLP